MKRWLKTVLINLSSSARLQRLLEQNVIFSQYLMGIGAGSDVESSGELVLVQKLRQRYGRTGQALCVFDVGANQGQFLSLIVNGLPDIPFCVHAFEPAQHTFKILYRNFNDRQNIFLNNFGLGKQPGQFELFYDQIGSGLASLSRRRLDHFGIAFQRSEMVTLQTLDEYCTTHRVEMIDLLKLDVEGHELDVLSGGTQMFRRRRIGMVSFEFGGCNIDSRTYFQDFFYFFLDHQMNRIYRITPSGHLVAIPEYKEVSEQFRTTNYLVLQSEAEA